MPIRKRTVYPKRSPFIHYDPKTGEREMRVPGACIKWPQPFRERIIRDWRSPDLAMPEAGAQSYVRYMTMPPFIVQGLSSQFHVICGPAKRKPNLFQCYTYLLVEGLDGYLYLGEDDPIVRSLQVYSFITKEVVWGLEALIVVDHLDPSAVE